MTASTPATILVVDDHRSLLSSIRLTLEADDFKVVTAKNGLEALKVLKNNIVSLILADIAMPVMNGYQFFESVRQNSSWIKIPFLFLTARGMDSDVRFGKEMGADDYLTKPIEPEDLLATVHGKLKRAEQWESAMPASSTASEAHSSVHKKTRNSMVVGDIEILPGQHRVWNAGKHISLSAREFRLLDYLAKYPNQLISAKQLVSATHGYESDEQEASNLIRPLIRTLRRKLGFKTGEAGPIETVRGIGYRLLSQP